VARLLQLIGERRKVDAKRDSRYLVRVRRLLVTLALVLLASSCSGEDSPVDNADDPANAAIPQVDRGSGGISEGPFRGLLVVQPSFGFGVYDLDGDTGVAKAIPGIAAAETVDRGSDLTVSNQAAYTLGRKRLEGQDFASEVSVVKFNYQTGLVSQVVALGADRESDDSEQIVEFAIETVAGDNIVVSQQTIGDSNRTFAVYDGTSGKKEGSFDVPTYREEKDDVVCQGEFTQPVGLADGRVVGAAAGVPAFIDIDDGDVKPMLECGQRLVLSDYVSAAEIAQFAVFSQGPAPTDDDIQSLLRQDLGPRSGLTAGGGDLWWIVANPRSEGETNAIVGGLVQFDIDSAQVEQVHSLGGRLGEFASCGAEPASCELSTIAEAGMRFVDGRLFIADARNNGQLLVVTQADGSIRPVAIGRGEADFTSTRLLSGDPAAIWLEVRRLSVSEGGTASGSTFIERYDPTTGIIDRSLAADDLFF